MSIKRRFKTGLVLMLAALAMLLAACGGGEEQTGVELEVAGDAVQPTATATPEPATDPADTLGDGTTSEADAVLGELRGRLLVLRGATFELLDLESGETLVFEDTPRAYSPAVLDRDASHAAYSAFPNYGVLGLVDGSATMVQNSGSTPTGFMLSPDGQWLAAFTGAFTNRLQVLAVDGSATYNVVASSTTTFEALWLSDSRLVWWESGAEEPAFQLFDPAVGESTPLDDPDLEVEPPAALSPDGARVANVPIAFRPDDAAADSDACFDSYVELYDAPFTLANAQAEADVIWTETNLVASSPQWLDATHLLFVKLGTGTCGEVQGDPLRMVMLLDTSAAAPEPVAVAGPLGNADDPNDRPQQGKALGHLYAPSPDGRYVAWIDGGFVADTSVIKVTELQSGLTVTVLRTSRDEVTDAADYIENHIFRQVVWLE